MPRPQDPASAADTQPFEEPDDEAQNRNPGKPETPTWSKRRSFWAWVSAVALTFVVVGLIVWAMLGGDPSQVDPPLVIPPTEIAEQGKAKTDSATSTASEPLRVVTIDVNHFASTEDGDISRGLLGQQTFTPLLGDHVRVQAKLSKPGYAYLIAFRPDGVADLCFPESDDKPPPLSDTPQYPPEDQVKSYGLRDGTGLWVFAVVASEQPLPSYSDWLDERTDITSVWEPMPTLPPGVVWWHDGLSDVDHLTSTGVQAPRGKDETLEGPAVTVKRLIQTLREVGRADTASAIAFSVVSAD